MSETTSATPKADVYREVVSEDNLAQTRKQLSEVELLTKLRPLISKHAKNDMLSGALFTSRSLRYVGLHLLHAFIEGMDGEEESPFTDEYVAGAGHMLTGMLMILAATEEQLGQKGPHGVSIIEMLNEADSTDDFEAAIQRQVDKISSPDV